MPANNIMTAISIEYFKPEFNPEIIAEKTGLEGALQRVAKFAQSAAKICSCSGTALIAGIEAGPGTDEISLDGVIFKSGLLREKISGLGRVFPYIATEGQEMAAWGESHRRGENAALVHAIRQIAVKSCESELEKRLCAMYGIPLLSTMNPGSLKEWPINQQAVLLDIFGSRPQKMGVTLMSDNIMQPDYTVSGIFFQTDKKYYNCQLCPRENCPNRKTKRENPNSMS